MKTLRPYQKEHIHYKYFNTFLTYRWYILYIFVPTKTKKLWKQQLTNFLK